jgi:exopolyphosphatase/guanosine-5'-triphosphate,3'-diphosphate pyrophosphatase
MTCVALQRRFAQSLTAQSRVAAVLSPDLQAPLAAIDLGSNSFRLEIARLVHGRYQRIVYLKETVRLGAGLDAAGALTEEAVERGLACLRRFAARLSDLPRERVRAVATQTLREASNRDAFLLRARDALEHPIEVVSGREEARLIYAGVAHMQPSERRRLVIDIGGRSTEMILGRGTRALRVESFAVGSVSLSMRYFGDGQLTAKAFRAAQVAAGAELEEALAPYSRERWDEALGSSGTIGALSTLLAAAGRDDGAITPRNLQWLIQRSIEAGHVDRLDFAGLKVDRRPVIAGGLALLYTLVAQFDIERLLPARGALRQGVIFDLHARLGAVHKAPEGDPRDHSVTELQSRFQIDVDQAHRVSDVALHLFAQVAPNDHEGARELGWAAELHELGLLVSHHDHHRHSAYLLSNVDAAAFSQTQQRELAQIVLAQRGGLRKVEQALAARRFALQALALRLSVIVNHARDGATPLADLSMSVEGSHARLKLAPAWAEANPRSLYLLQEEAQAWERIAGELRLSLC